MPIFGCVFLLHRPPFAAVSGEELDGFDRTIGAGGVIGKAVAQIFAEGDDLVGQLPGGFDLVPPGKQSRITTHDVVDQTLVGFRCVALVRAEVAGLDFDRHDVFLGGKVLGVDLEIDADIGLDADDQEVGLLVVFFIFEVQDIGQGFELDDNLGAAAGEAFAGADIERCAGPAEIVDAELHGDEGLGAGVLRDVELFAVAGDFFTVDGARAILAEDDVVAQGICCERCDRLDDLELFLADGFGGQADRRLHGDHREDLQDVVLDHVANRPGMFVIATAGANAELFAE